MREQPSYRDPRGFLYSRTSRIDAAITAVGDEFRFYTGFSKNARCGFAVVDQVLQNSEGNYLFAADLTIARINEPIESGVLVGRLVLEYVEHGVPFDVMQEEEILSVRPRVDSLWVGRLAVSEARG